MSTDGFKEWGVSTADAMAGAAAGAKQIADDFREGPRAPTLTDFLLARIAEDVAACRGGHEPESWCDRATGVHYNPGRVLAECEAKRGILALWEVGDLDDSPIYWLALPYADHPDYREEWKP